MKGTPPWSYHTHPLLFCVLRVIPLPKLCILCSILGPQKQVLYRVYSLIFWVSIASYCMCHTASIAFCSRFHSASVHRAMRKWLLWWRCWGVTCGPRWRSCWRSCTGPASSTAPTAAWPSPLPLSPLPSLLRGESGSKCYTRWIQLSGSRNCNR